MPSHDCPKDAELLAFDQGELAGDSRERVESHLNGECECAARLLELTALPSGLRELVEDTSPPPELPGYEYERDAGRAPVELGQGGQGTVYLAKRRSDGRRVAVKFLTVQGGTTPPSKRFDFVREVEAVNGLRHDNIIRIFDLGGIDGRLFYVMEYVPGSDLFNFQFDGDVGRPFPKPTEGDWGRFVAGAMHKLADAVAEAHRHGVLHRDLKPGNILVRSEGWDPSAGLPGTKLTDFGLAKRFDARTLDRSQGQMRGTPHYMAPEQVEWDNATGLNPAVDVYGLGAVLYFMLTGRSPFEHESSEHRLREAVLRAEPPPPSSLNPEVPRDLETVCLKCLRKEPRDRYETVAELAADCASVRDGRPIKARRWTPAERAGRWVKRNRAAALVMASLALLLAASVGGGLAAWHFAERSSQNARKAERSAEEATENAYAKIRDAAKFALGRGDFEAAVGHYDDAIAMAPPEDRTELEVRRLRCLSSARDWERTHAEIQRLSEIDLTQRQHAEVLLLQADSLMREADEGSQQRGRELTREALNTGRLGRADEAFARGLLAEGSTEAIDHFTNAVEVYRFHLKAREALLIELSMTGQFAAAEREAEFYTSVWPRDPTGPLFRVLVATILERPDRDRHLRRASELFGDPREAELLARVVRAADRFIASARNSAKPSPWQRLLQGVGLDFVGGSDVFATLLPLVLEIRRAHAQAGQTVTGLNSVLLYRPLKVYQGIMEAHAMFQRKDVEGMLRVLEPLERQYPEALVRHYLGLAHLEGAGQLEMRGDWAAAYDRSLVAYRYFENAAEAPTLLPFVPFRHNADWSCVILDTYWRRNRVANAAWVAGVGLTGSETGPLQGPVLAFALDVADHVPREDVRPHLQRAITRSGADDGFRAMWVPSMHAELDYQTLRAILIDWAEDTPDDAVPAVLLAEVAHDRGHWADARDWAARSLRLRSRDAGMRRILEAAKDRLAVSSKSE